MRNANGNGLPNSGEVFDRSFTQQEPIPEEAIERAVAVMRHGRLHRYNRGPDEHSETELLEQEFAVSVGAKFCLAVASCGYAISCALRSMGVRHGQPVLMNSFTLAPVPGAIASVGAKPVLVETTSGLVIDLDDLKAKIRRTKARVLVLSHMRGHICDMDELMRICSSEGISVVEDCAHTMGAKWNGTPSGRHGVLACYSTQTYKHINSGEGGLIATDDAELMARAVVHSGSYMHFDKHLAAPPEEFFREASEQVPNCSGRMDNLRAALLRPQLRALPSQCASWNERYFAVEKILRSASAIRVIERKEEEEFVGSSMQFMLPEFSAEEIAETVSECAARGVELKWFGRAEPVGFTSRYVNWKYFDRQNCPQTDEVLATLLDMRLPLTFSISECRKVANIIVDTAGRICDGAARRQGEANV